MLLLFRAPTFFMHLTHNIKVISEYIKLCFAEEKEIGYNSLHGVGVSGCVPRHEPVVKIVILCQEGMTWTKA